MDTIHKVAKGIITIVMIILFTPAAAMIFGFAVCLVVIVCGGEHPAWAQDMATWGFEHLVTNIDLILK